MTPGPFPLKAEEVELTPKCTLLQKQELEVGDKAEPVWFSG